MVAEIIIKGRIMVKEKTFYKTLLTLALPVAFQSLISIGVNMSDNLMVGGLGQIKFSGVATANMVTVFLMFFIRGVSGGASLMISQYWGKKDIERIRSIFGIIFQICTVFTTAAALLIYFFPGDVMSIFTNNAEVIAAGTPFIRVVCFSYILFCITDSMISMLRCVEVVKISLVISVVTFFMNLLFNYLLIYGKFGFPALGIVGSAISTVIARAIELVIVLIYVFLMEKRVRLKVKDLFRVDGLLYKDFFRYGVPIVAGDLQWGLVGTFKSMIIGRLGPTMISANSITDLVLSLGAIFTSGLSNAACVIIGKTVGVSDYKKTREYSGTIQILFVAVGVIMMAIVFLTRPFALSFYSTFPAETLQTANTMLAIGAITMLGTTYHAACFTGINRGAGDSRFVFKVDMICGWLIVLPLTFLVAFVLGWPLPIVFLFTRIDQCFKWLIALIRLRGNKWIHNVTRS